MELIDRIKAKFQRRHLHLIAAAFFLTNGMYLHQAGHLNTTTPGVIDSFVMLCTVLSFPYLIWYGARVAPWRELRRIVAAGSIVWISISFLAGTVAYYSGFSGESRAFFLSLPAGLEIYSLLVGITGVTILLAVPLVCRYGYRLVSGAGGNGGGTIPEEQVLSEEELDEFDHPTKNLMYLLRKGLLSLNQ